MLLFLTASAAGQGAVELIIVNGNVRTLNKDQPSAQAVASSGGRIVAVGTDHDIKALAGPQSVIIDAEKRLVLPGFNDAHVHFTAIGNRFSHLDLRDAESAEDVVKRVEYFCRFLPKGRWLIGAGLDSSRWRSTAPPALERLDAVSKENPILLYFADPRTAIVNSAALRASLIAQDHGNMVRGQELARVRNAVPKSSGTNFAEFAETASNYAASLGVTSVQDVHSDNDLAMLASLSRSGKLKTRVYDCVGLRAWEDARPDIKIATEGQDLVRGGCVKWYSDGTPDELPELRARISSADKAGMQVLVHAIGETANSNALDALEYAIAQNGQRDRRSRIEHAHRLRRQEYGRLLKANIIASMQPYLFYNNGLTVGDDHRAIIKSGVKLAFGSDASMVDLNPMLGIHAAVNAGNRSISVEEAIMAYTLGSAYAEFQESQKGTIEFGKFADMIILSDDLFTIAPRKIESVKVLMTVMGGKVVFEAR